MSEKYGDLTGEGTVLVVTEDGRKECHPGGGVPGRYNESTKVAAIAGINTKPPWKIAVHFTGRITQLGISLRKGVPLRKHDDDKWMATSCR